MSIESVSKHSNSVTTVEAVNHTVAVSYPLAAPP